MTLVGNGRSTSTLDRLLTIVCLILAGETIFCLPFHVARFFRPTMLSVFNFTNTELGVIQGVYGVVAMIAYFPGGPIADRISARKLLAASLVATSLGGLYFATFPGYAGMCVLFGYLGATTILLFWAALIRATREWGTDETQGWAYGILDGGRGLVAALMASAVVLLLALWLPDDPTSATAEQRATALRNVICVYTASTFFAGVLVYLFVPDRDPREATSERVRVSGQIRAVLGMPAVWLLAVIVVCAYVGYKGLDNYSLYAVQVYGMDEVAGAQVSTIGAWLRPIAAVGAGLLGDRIRASRSSALCFALLAGSYLYLIVHDPEPSAAWILYLNVVVSCAATFGLRGVYFALLEEGSVQKSLTGTAVGLASVVGYTPDVFVAAVGGWLLDRSPGAVGHQHYLIFLLLFAAAGLVTSLAFASVFTSAQPHRDET